MDGAMLHYYCITLERHVIIALDTIPIHNIYIIYPYYPLFVFGKACNLWCWNIARMIWTRQFLCTHFWDGEFRWPKLQGCWWPWPRPRGADHTFDQPALLRASMVNLEIGEGSTGSFSNFEVLLEVLSGPQNVEKINKLSNIPIRTRIISIVQNWINCPTKLLTQFLQVKQGGWRPDLFVVSGHLANRSGFPRRLWDKTTCVVLSCFIDFWGKCLPRFAWSTCAMWCPWFPSALFACLAVCTFCVAATVQAF